MCLTENQNAVVRCPCTRRRSHRRHQEQGRRLRKDARFIPVFHKTDVGILPMTKNRLVTVAMAVAAIAIINRIPAAKKVVNGS